MLNLLEAIPLTIFAFWIRHMDTQVPGNWGVVFMVSGLAAIVVTSICLHKKISLNRIFLGINIYLCCGGLTFATKQWWLTRVYEHFQASGMILWVIIIGLISTLVSPNGFVGVHSPDKKRIQTFSVYLILLSLGAFAVSYAFRGNALLSEMIPFVGLVVGYNVFKKKAMETLSPEGGI
ncbi:MAG: hypothetical protein MI749_02410 [Desulfovibrionales bacterium]|nr:hypothetical protein [Desulfovibrionales bacterium]